MNSNEIELVLKQKGFERGVKECLFRISEEQMEMRKSISEMAKAFTALATVQTMLNEVADGMEAKLKRLEKQDDDPTSTRGLIEQ